MKYIVVDKKNLSVNITERRSRKGFIVPIILYKYIRMLSPIEKDLYYGVLYPLYEAKYFQKHPDEKGNVAFKLIEPDPWMIAMAFIMWEGIVQGLAWDTVKLIVKTALSTLASVNLAPLSTANKKLSRRTTKEHTQIGFAWEIYGKSGNKQHDIFIGLKTIYESMTEKEREAVSNSIIEIRNSDCKK